MITIRKYDWFSYSNYNHILMLKSNMMNWLFRLVCDWIASLGCVTMVKGEIKEI